MEWTYPILQRIFIIFILTAIQVEHTEAKTGKSKIVFMPFSAVSSQYFNSLKIADEMAERGHQVSILTTPLLKKRKSIVEHIEYRVPGEDVVGKMHKTQSSQSKKPGLFSYLSSTKQILKFQVDSCFAILRNNDSRKAILEADMLVIVSLMSCGYYVADIFNKPFIVLHVAMFSIIGSFTGGPVPASYLPIIGSNSSDEMGFLERTHNFLMYRLKDSLSDIGISYYFKTLQAEYDWKSNESFAQLFARAEMYILTMDFAYQWTHPLMPNVFYVGSVLSGPPAPLPKDLEDFMRTSGDHGVVLVSFGTTVSSLNRQIIENMMVAFSHLKQKVIWKIHLQDGIEIPPNVKILDWLPQNDLLGHEKTKAFVGHMGINGASEAAYHGVPIVAACIMIDHHHNTATFLKKTKMLKFIDIYNADSDLWLSTIKEVIYNSSYKDNAMRTSKLLRSWPRSSLERAGDLIQYALDNGGRLPHLKSYAGNLYWFQYHCVDVIMFLISCCAIIIFVLIKVAKLCLSFICNIGKKSKRD